MITTEFINYNDKLYQLYRKVKQSHVKEGHINDVKDMWNCDLVLRTKNEEEVYLLFIKEIEEVKIIKNII
jgi:hypothetical protein